MWFLREAPFSWSVLHKYSYVVQSYTRIYTGASFMIEKKLEKIYVVSDIGNIPYRLKHLVPDGAIWKSVRHCGWQWPDRGTGDRWYVLQGSVLCWPLLTLSFCMSKSVPIHPWCGALLKAQKQWSHAKDKILELRQNKPDTYPRDMMIIQKLGYIHIYMHTIEYLAPF